MIKENFDLLINATYSNLNNHIYHLKNKLLMEYNLQEMCRLKINGKRFGLHNIRWRISIYTSCGWV